MKTESHGNVIKLVVACLMSQAILAVLVLSSFVTQPSIAHGQMFGQICSQGPIRCSNCINLPLNGYGCSNGQLPPGWLFGGCVPGLRTDQCTGGIRNCGINVNCTTGRQVGVCNQMTICT
jgi:hypothetical protein